MERLVWQGSAHLRDVSCAGSTWPHGKDVLPPVFMSKACSGQQPGILGKISSEEEW